MMFRILSAAALVCALALAAAAQDDKSKQAEVKISGGERDAAQKIEKAKGTEARLQAAVAFLKKYPQSPLRRQVAQSLAQEVANSTDEQAKISLAETYRDIFNLPEEAQLINPTLLNAYITAGRTDEALKLGTDWLAKHPDDVQILENLAILASNEAIKGNNVYTQQGREYAAKAIAAVEADKAPEGYDAARWTEFKSKETARLYRTAGVLAYTAGDKKGALPLMEKAAALRINDPGVYILLGNMAFEAYDWSNKEYMVASAAEKPAALKKREEAIDNVIQAYARAVAATDGQAQFQEINTGLRGDLEKFYKSRHNNSTEGMQQLIDKYKQPAQ